MRTCRTAGQEKTTWPTKYVVTVRLHRLRKVSAVFRQTVVTDTTLRNQPSFFPFLSYDL